MATLTLVVRPDGRAILTAPTPLSQAMRERLIGELREWEDGKWPILVLDDCDVAQVGSFEIELGEPVPA